MRTNLTDTTPPHPGGTRASTFSGGGSEPDQQAALGAFVGIVADALRDGNGSELAVQPMRVQEAFVAPDLQMAAAAPAGFLEDCSHEHAADALAARQGMDVEPHQSAVASAEANGIVDHPARAGSTGQGVEELQGTRADEGALLLLGDPEGVAPVEVVSLEVIEVGVIAGGVPGEAVLLVDGADHADDLFDIYGSGKADGNAHLATPGPCSLPGDEAMRSSMFAPPGFIVARGARWMLVERRAAGPIVPLPPG